jgi:hypothetical protein
MKVHHQEVSCRTQALWYNITSKCIWCYGESSICCLLIKTFILIRNLIFLKISERAAAVQPSFTSRPLVLTHYLKHFKFSRGLFLQRNKCLYLPSPYARNEVRNLFVRALMLLVCYQFTSALQRNCEYTQRLELRIYPKRAWEIEFFQISDIIFSRLKKYSELTPYTLRVRYLRTLTYTPKY